MLLRLFNDDTPLVNLSKGWVGQQKQNGAGKGDGGMIDVVDKKVDEQLEGSAEPLKRRNSSSPEPQQEADDDEDGGVDIAAE